MSTKAGKREQAEERRRAKRTVVRESFSLFLVIPEALGMARIYIRDLSRLGLSFRPEIDCGLSQGQQFEARLYLNPAFYLPVNCRVVRLTASEVGVEFVKPQDGAVKAVGLLQDFFEAAEVSGVLVE